MHSSQPIEPFPWNLSSTIVAHGRRGWLLDAIGARFWLAPVRSITPLAGMKKMLTRLKVSGFKNLVNVDVAFGPFTCIAGHNASGKSNLFDAITFLSSLADLPLMDAAASIRSQSGKAADVQHLFHQAGGRIADQMSFEVEMLIPETGTDDLGQVARATTTFVRYRLDIGHRTPNSVSTTSELQILREELDRIPIGDAPKYLRFPHALAWRKSAVTGARRAAFISTDGTGDQAVVKMHQEQRSGRPRHLLAARLPRTVLSSSNAAENPTALLARREMQSWRQYQLEPAAMREPDTFRAPTRLATDGRHLPATLASLAQLYESRQSGGGERFYASIANRLASLIEDVAAVDIDHDDKRELLTLLVRDQFNTVYPARALSDGTLRFLALSAIEADPSFRGVICLEEPENGIHPDRIPAILALLHDLAVDTSEEVGPDNPLRQVIINTHSPGVVGQVSDSELLMALPQVGRANGNRYTSVTFAWLANTWRAEAYPDRRPLSRGELLAYLNPHRFEEDVTRWGRRVIDRDDLAQLVLPLRER